MTTEVKKTLLQEVKKVDHGSKKTLLQEVKKVDTIKTDNINTNLSRPSEPEGAEGNSLYSIEDAPQKTTLELFMIGFFQSSGDTQHRLRLRT